MQERQLHPAYRLFFVFVAVLLLGFGCSSDVSPESTGVEPGQHAFDFSLESFHGEQVLLSDYRGKVVLLDFWAIWCPFCTEELPELQAIQDGMEDVVVLGVHRTETESVVDARAFIEELGVTYTQLQDTDGTVYQFYSGGRPFMPLAFVINKGGVVCERIIGPKLLEQLNDSIKSCQTSMYE